MRETREMAFQGFEMDPPPLIHCPSPAAPSQSSTGPPYALSEIWSLDSANLLEIQPRRGSFSRNLGFFYSLEAGPVRDASAAEESTVTEQSGSLGGGGWRKRDAMAVAASEDESSKRASTSSGNDRADSNGKRLEVVSSGGENGDLKEVEPSSGDGNKMAEQNSQPSEAPKQDYIHVRARRGQATDSHSLAERVRREKINERLKILQGLVPGCNKVLGKALVLDEIINYILSLQRQVEFLSMKLEAVNSRTHSGMEGFPAEDKHVISVSSSIVLNTMSEVFEGYERQYCEISANLSKKCSSASHLSGEQKKQKVSEIKSGLDDAEALIRKMDLEARSLQPSVKATLLTKLREYKSDMNNLKSELKRITSPNANQVARDELMESGMADTLMVSADQRGRLLMSTERLNQSSDRVKESRRTMLETEELGVSILQDLHQQRQSLLHAHNTLHGVDDNIGKSRKILTAMSRRMSRNKWIVGSIIAALALAIVLILYFKLAH